jgi:hypothetical protein
MLEYHMPISGRETGIWRMRWYPTNRCMLNAAHIYRATYDTLCGRHPWERHWHFQWLAATDLRRELRRTLPKLSGRVLDVGCGQKPYTVWMPAVVE